LPADNDVLIDVVPYAVIVLVLIIEGHLISRRVQSYRRSAFPSPRNRATTIQMSLAMKSTDINLKRIRRFSMLSMSSHPNLQKIMKRNQLAKK
jgi:hypothetical protein